MVVYTGCFCRVHQKWSREILQIATIWVPVITGLEIDWNSGINSGMDNEFYVQQMALFHTFL